MKNLKKTLAVVTAIAAMLAAAPAFAEIQATVEPVSGITVTPSNIDTAPAVTVTLTDDDAVSGEITFLILDHGTDVANIGADDILYIDQKTGGKGTSFTGNINLSRVAAYIDGTALPEGVYPIRIGYSSPTSAGGFAIKSATLVVAEQNSVVTVSIKWGDVNNDNSVTVLDASAVLERAIGGDTQFAISGRDEKLIINNPYRIQYNESDAYNIVWGDVNNDNSVTVLDASAVLERAIGGDTQFAISGSANKFVIGNAYSLIIE